MDQRECILQRISAAQVAGGERFFHVARSVASMFVGKVLLIPLPSGNQAWRAGKNLHLDWGFPSYVSIPKDISPSNPH